MFKPAFYTLMAYYYLEQNVIDIELDQGSCSSKFNSLNIAAGSHEVEIKEQNVQTEESVEQQGMWLHLHFIL